MSLVVVSAGLFALGLYGVLTRRDLVGVLASIEVMIGGALVLLVGLAASRLSGASSAASAATVEGATLLVLVLAACEAAVGLALLVAVARAKHSTRVEDLTEVRG